MIEMHSNYDIMHTNGMFYALFSLIIIYYHVKIACYQRSNCPKIVWIELEVKCLNDPCVYEFYYVLGDRIT